ncbi:hypothetical protein [Bradyrhizobium sp. BR 1432]
MRQQLSIQEHFWRRNALATTHNYVPVAAYVTESSAGEKLSNTKKSPK